MDSRKIILDSLKNDSKLSNRHSSLEQLIYTLNSKSEIIKKKSQAEIINEFEREVINNNGELIKCNSTDELIKQFEHVILSGSIPKIATTTKIVEEEKYSQAFQYLMQSNVEIIKTDYYHKANRKEILNEVPYAIVEAQAGISELGSVLFTMKSTLTSYPHFISSTVITLLSADKIYPDYFSLFEESNFEELQNSFFVAGPSRSADIEKKLVLGAHGPSRFIILLIMY